MAGDWLKIREDLHEDPAVLQIAAGLETRPEHVVGYCHRFWGWVSRQCHAGSVTGVTLLSVESVLNLPGFLSLLVSVGWLEYDETGSEPVITIPKFERHLSEGGKTRALAAERQRQRRHADVTKVSRTQRDETVTREEKRREEEVTTNVVTLSLDELTTAPSSKLPKPPSPEKVFSRLQDVFSEKKLSRPRKLTADRKRKLTTRLRDPDWLGDLKGALDKLPVPGDGWQPDIDWLIENDGNVERLLEGKYDWRDNGDGKRPPYEPPSARQGDEEKRQVEVSKFVSAARKDGQTDEWISEQLIERGLSEDGKW